MRTRVFRLLLIAFIVCTTAEVVLAGVFPGLFSFAHPGLNSLFLFPFQIAGCG
ncbi:MAG TPA: hypothetical protein VM243_10225 [Phycisphaerae bacterium]|nr:hypothetical protein [Phycisphaerae bacterium]